MVESHFKDASLIPFVVSYGSTLNAYYSSRIGPPTLWLLCGAYELYDIKYH